MHFYCLTRGVKDVVDRYINDLLAAYFPWSDEKPKGTDKLIQLSVRPVQLWEIVFPEEHTDKAMRLVCPRHGWDKRCKPFATVIRKILRIGKMPEMYNFKEGEKRGIVSSQYVSVIPIGMKKDVFKKGIEQL